MRLSVFCHSSLLTKRPCFFPPSLLRSSRHLPFVFLVLAMPLAIMAQEAPVQPANGTALVGQVLAAFSGGHAIHQVTLSGNVTWHAGSLEDSGPVALTASTDGQFQATFQLSRGQRQETQAGSGANAACTWTGSDGTVHSVGLTNCLKPAVWFLPAISLQTALLSNSLVASDWGQGAVGGDGVYRHLQIQLQLGGQEQTLTDVTAQSITDFGLDSTTLLPAVLAYKVHPDSGTQIPIAIEVRYSDYHNIDGVNIPFSIQRYVNNSVQLEIVVSSVHIN
jgi:hypothetical protein